MNLNKSDLEHLKNLRKVLQDQCEFNSKGVKELMLAAQSMQWMDTKLIPELNRYIREEENKSQAMQASMTAKEVSSEEKSE